MSIVQNANEEHQFVFAVNTISMVKSDALFSYLAPANMISWLLAPLRFFMSFRAFVRINRSVIKATHFPVLFGIYLYERLLLRRNIFEGTELLEDRGRSKFAQTAPEMRLNGLNIFRAQPSRVREPSVATFHKDKALEEVFRGPLPAETASDTPRNHRQRQTSNVVSHWMSGMGPEGSTHPPIEQDRSILDRLESRHPVHRRSQMAMRRRQGESTRDFTEATMSIASDPEDFVGRDSLRPPLQRRQPLPFATPEKEEPPSQAADAADDELASDDDDDLLTLDQQNMVDQDDERDIPSSSKPNNQHRKVTEVQHMNRDSPQNSLAHTLSSSSSSASRHKFPLATPPRITPIKKLAVNRAGRHHIRNASTNTIIYDPQSRGISTAGSLPSHQPARRSGKVTPNPTRPSSGRQTPKKQVKAIARPIMPPRTAFQSAPDLAGMLSFAMNPRHGRRSSLTSFDIGSDIGDNKAIGGRFVDAAIPASFATQLGYAKAGMRARKAAIEQEKEVDKDRISRLMLARMSTLEEGFREMIKEVQGIREVGAARYSDPQSANEDVSRKNGRVKGQAGEGKREAKGKENAYSDRLAFDMESDEIRR